MACIISHYGKITFDKNVVYALTIVKNNLRAQGGANALHHLPINPWRCELFSTLPLLPLAVRAVNKPHSLGTVRALTYALTHLASARTTGIRCAMKCLARPCARGGFI